LARKQGADENRRTARNSPDAAGSNLTQTEGRS
jgi:hypothetical protein